MARFRGHQRGRIQIPRRTAEWVNSADQDYVSVGANASNINQSNSTLGNTTIVRIRGMFSVVNTAEVDGDIIGAWGFGIVSAQAFAAGAASIPGPYTNGDWDGWFAHGYWSYRQELIGVGANVWKASVEAVIDNKAMRKVNDTDVVVVMTESQAVACKVAINFRMLLKLA